MRLKTIGSVMSFEVSTSSVARHPRTNKSTALSISSPSTSSSVRVIVCFTADRICDENWSRRETPASSGSSIDAKHSTTPDRSVIPICWTSRSSNWSSVATTDPHAAASTSRKWKTRNDGGGAVASLFDMDDVAPSSKHFASHSLRALTGSTSGWGSIDCPSCPSASGPPGWVAAV